MSKNNDVAAIILAGGQGTRFRQVIGNDSQKVLYPVGGKPLIQYSTDLLHINNVSHLVFNLGYKAKDVETWVLEQKFSQRVSFSPQSEWSIYNAVVGGVGKTDEDTIICCNADEIRLGLNIAEVIDFHRQHGRLMTMVGAFRNCLSRHRLLHTREDGLLVSSQYNSNEFEKNQQVTGLVNAGFTIFNRHAVEMFDANHHSNGWDALLDPLCSANEIVVFSQQILTFFNVGTLEELIGAEQFFYSDTNQ
jgi:D-glycero-alpha-D-manno-heptose 1-phosphate guanylyltransferase